MNKDYLLRQIALQRKYEKDCLPGKPVKQVNLSGQRFMVWKSNIPRSVKHASTATGSALYALPKQRITEDFG